MHSLNPTLWVKKYADKLYAYAFIRLKDEMLANDLIQDTFLSALQAKDRFKGNASELTWLTSILRNKISDHFRKNKSQGFHQSIDDLEDSENESDDFFQTSGKTGHWNASSAPKSWDSILQSESDVVEFLEKCLELIPDRWRLLFKMKYIDEQKSDQICNETGISSSNYWVIMHRARLELRACIEKQQQQ